MLKIKHNTYNLIAAFLLIALLLSACSGDQAERKPQEQFAEIYSTALDSIMENDPALHHHAEYIALDMTRLDHLDDQDKREILDYFNEKYNIKVMEASFEELKETGVYNPDTVSIDGVLLALEKVDFVSDYEVLIEGSKYKSGLGSFGAKLIVHYVNHNWQLKEFKTTRES